MILTCCNGNNLKYQHNNEHTVDYCVCVSVSVCVPCMCVHMLSQQI